MWYKIDFDRLVLLLLPTFLRKPVLFGYVRALITPIASLHYKWSLMRNENIKKLSYNSQRCYLRKALNDKYDPELRRITIGGTLNQNQDYIYTSAENLDYGIHDQLGSRRGARRKRAGTELRPHIRRWKSRFAK